MVIISQLLSVYQWPGYLQKHTHPLLVFNHRLYISVWVWIFTKNIPTPWFNILFGSAGIHIKIYTRETFYTAQQRKQIYVEVCVCVCVCVREREYLSLFGW